MVSTANLVTIYNHGCYEVTTYHGYHGNHIVTLVAKLSTVNTTGPHCNYNLYREINKQLMTCLTVALEEIKELRRQLSDRGNQTDVKTPLHVRTGNEVLSPSQDRSSAEWDSNDNISTPGSVRIVVR